MKARRRPNALLKTVELCKQDGPHPQQRLADGLKARMPFYQLFDPSGKVGPRRLADLQPEAAQNPAQAVLEVQIAKLCSTSWPATNAKRLRKGANGSRECAPDDRLRDEAIHLDLGTWIASLALAMTLGGGCST